MPFEPGAEVRRPLPAEDLLRRRPAEFGAAVLLDYPGPESSSFTEIMDNEPMFFVAGMRQAFAILVGAGAFASGLQGFQDSRTSPDMQAARRLPGWRRAVVSIPAALYAGWATWRLPPMKSSDSFFGAVFGDYALYDPLVFVALSAACLLAGGAVGKSRAAKMALTTLLATVLLALPLTAVLLGLRAVWIILTA